MCQNSQTQTVTNLKNLNCDRTPKFKWWQKIQTQIVTKLKKTNILTKLKKKIYQNLKTQVVTKLRNMNSDETQDSNLDITQNYKSDKNQ